MENLEEMPKGTVITLGKTENLSEFRKGDALIYTYLQKKERESVMNRAKLILSRSGYSTIMDLAVLGKKAIFVPTPGQTEQEYLSRYHMEKGTYYSMDQKKMDIKKAMKEVQRYRGIVMDGGQSVKNVLNEVL
jgi:UDP-N-acetylglucosamine:LPS N-acetylglucosamine transferase